jgi:hypothetical protein
MHRDRGSHEARTATARHIAVAAASLRRRPFRIRPKVRAARKARNLAESRSLDCPYGLGRTSICRRQWFIR